MTEQVETAPETGTDHRADSINVTDGASAKVKSLLEQEGRDDLALRIAVQPGGCSTSCSSTSAPWTAMC
jgi:hypothetical protein